MNLSNLIFISMIIGIIIGLFVMFGLGFDEVWALLISPQTNYMYLLLAGAMQCCSLLMLFMRWERIVSYSKIKIRKQKLFLSTLAGIAFSNLTPSARLGGEPLRAYFLRKYGRAAKNRKLHTSNSLATVITEKLFDAATFSILSFLVLILALVYWNLPLWVVLILFLSFIACSSVIIFIVYISLNKTAGFRVSLWCIDKFAWLIRRVRPISVVKKKLRRNVERYHKCVVSILKTKEMWINGLVFSFGIWFFDILRTYFVFKALGIEVSFVLIASVLVISAIAGALPFFPGGLAVIESTMIIIYTASAIPLVVAGMVTLLDRLLSFWALTFAGVGSAYYLGFAKVPKVKKTGKTKARC